MFVDQVAYLLSGITGRFHQSTACPACKSTNGSVCDRKWFHSLIECRSCGLLHRFPTENEKWAFSYYNGRYAEPQATQLPSDDELADLLSNSFKGTDKDFTHHSAILKALGIRGRILDYGANWGYASWQFAHGGFDVVSYEISQKMAEFGKKLGVAIETDISRVGVNFDAVYSSHVLEHIPDPRSTILKQLTLVKPGGLVVAHTPNGSRAYRTRAPSFSLSWGQVHPVLLTANFVEHVAEHRPFLVTSDDRPERLARWDQFSQIKDLCADAGLLFAIRA
jgi:2-polyprenyl-3-methyl-5-hydroxy-6-metoxy-1,4-benzoquinol methylase